MDIAVPSRFACLRIEDDDFRPANSKPKKKVDNNKQTGKKPDKSTKQESNVKKTVSKQVRYNTLYLVVPQIYMYIMFRQIVAHRTRNPKRNSNLRSSGKSGRKRIVCW